jgi:predicted small lipoprotein YifL
LYGAAALGIFVVNRNYSPTSCGWAVILLSAATLALGGCGRKAGLDLPPNASSQSDTAVQADPDAEQAATPSVFNPNYGSDAPPTASKGTKRSFVLDPLLNN